MSCFASICLYAPFLYFERNEKDIKAGKNVKISQNVP